MTAPSDGSGPAHAASTPGPLRRSSRWLAAVPRHVGRARTSTVVLSLLFLAIGTLYLNVHPTAAQTPAPAGGVVAPRPAAPRTHSPARTTAPATTPSVPGTRTSSVPSPSAGPTAAPTSTAPGATPSPSAPAPAPSSTSGLPTAGSASAAPTS